MTNKYNKFSDDNDIDMVDDFALSSEKEEVPQRYIEDVEDSEEGCDDDSYVSSLFRNNNIVGFYKDEEHPDQGYSIDGYEPDEIEEYLHDYLKFYSKEERDFILLNFVMGKSQVELMEIFRKTQPALCNDSNRIKKEIKVIMNIKDFSEEILKFLLSNDNGLNYFSRDVLVVFFYSMSVTKTSKILGVNPMLCRARIEKSIEGLKKAGHIKIYNYFQYILENLNKIKRAVSEEFGDKKTSRMDYSDGHLLQEFNFDE